MICFPSFQLAEVKGARGEILEAMGTDWNSWHNRREGSLHNSGQTRERATEIVLGNLKSLMLLSSLRILKILNIIGILGVPGVPGTPKTAS